MINDLVSQLQELTEKAKTGEVSALGFVVATESPDALAYGVVGELSTIEAELLIGRCRLLQARLERFVLAADEGMH